GEGEERRHGGEEVGRDLAVDGYEPARLGQPIVVVVSERLHFPLSRRPRSTWYRRSAHSSANRSSDSPFAASTTSVASSPTFLRAASGPLARRRAVYEASGRSRARRAITRASSSTMPAAVGESSPKQVRSSVWQLGPSGSATSSSVSPSQ